MRITNFVAFATTLILMFALSVSVALAQNPNSNAPSHSNAGGNQNPPATSNAGGNSNAAQPANVVNDKPAVNKPAKPASNKPAKPASNKPAKPNNNGSTQGNSPSDPDGMENGGPDKPGGSGGVNQNDQDGNNGSGNDSDCEDDNNGNGTPGKCKPKPNKPVNNGGNGGNGPADKVTLCHATGSATNPFVVITISANGLNGHGDHENDIIPAPAGGCGAVNEAVNEDGKITICHATGSSTNPYVKITISVNGLNGHGDHAGDIIPAPEGECVAPPFVSNPDNPNVATPEGSENGSGSCGVAVLCPDNENPSVFTPEDTQNGSGGSNPAADEEGNSELVAESEEVDRDTVGSLPFTGAELTGIVLLGLVLAAGGLWMYRNRA